MQKLNKNQKLVLYTLGVLGYFGFAKLNISKYEIENIKDIIDGLEQENLTTVDEYLTNINIENIEKEYVNGYINNKKDICNSTLKNMIKEILEAQIIEEYNLNPENINNFEIIGKRLYTKDKETYRDKYGVKFTYEDNYYELYADNKEAHKICFAYRALGYNELSLDEMDKYYEELKKILMSKIEKEEKKGEWSYYNQDNNKETIEYNGLFKIKEDKEKEKAVKKYIKTLEQ